MSEMPTSQPYGSWESPITAALIVEGAAAVRELRVDGDDIWWSEGRPSEGGRNQLVRRTPDGERHDVLPEGWNARTQVHEYGGGAWTVRDGVLWFSSWADQRLYRLDAGAGQVVPHPITPEPPSPRALRYADASVSPEPRNSRLFTAVVVTPAAASRPNTVWCGCHSAESTSLLHCRWLSSRSVPGMREV